jgi:site-specific DNA-methyltransferase (adenine-specific)
MKEMQADSVVMTLTDIPYEVVNRSSNGLRNFDKAYADEKTFDLDVFLAEVVRVTKGSIYCFCSTEQVSFIRSELIRYGLSTRLCILEKTNPSPVNGQHIWLSGIECCVFGKKKNAVFNEHCKNPVWRYPCERNKFHTTQKPLKLFEYLVKVSSNEGDVVFDPCVGSGTTALAAKRQGRQYIVYDLSEECIGVTKRRIDEDV